MAYYDELAVSVETVESIYEPLDNNRKEFRILHVGPGTNFHDTLDCTLETILSLQKPTPAYVAISYCWGEITGYETIRLNGRFHEVPSSAAVVLRQFRGHGLPLWIDALCINQADIMERNSQVLLMGQIYSSCSECFIWLGDSDENTSSVFKAMELIYDERYGKQKNSFGCSPLRGNTLLIAALGICPLEHFFAFFRRSWFTRVWVVQEAALAPGAICYCASLSIDCDVVRVAGLWIYNNMPPLKLGFTIPLSAFSTMSFLNAIRGHSTGVWQPQKLEDLLACTFVLVLPMFEIISMVFSHSWSGTNPSPST